MQLNTGRTFRPALAGALALALVAGGGGIFFASPAHVSHPAQASATINDLQILDRNEQAFQQMDELQQDEDGSQGPPDQAPAAPPSS